MFWGRVCRVKGHCAALGLAVSAESAESVDLSLLRCCWTSIAQTYEVVMYVSL